MARKNTTLIVADRVEKRRGKVIVMMIAASKMTEASTMTMPTTKGGAKEEDAVHCLAVDTIAASLCPSPPCMSHPLPLPLWLH